MTGTRSDNEGFVETKVKHHIELYGSLLVVENVPARVNLDTGETLFSHRTVERLHDLVRKPSQPLRVVETLVYDYA